MDPDFEDAWEYRAQNAEDWDRQVRDREEADE